MDETQISTEALERWYDLDALQPPYRPSSDWPFPQPCGAFLQANWGDGKPGGGLCAVCGEREDHHEGRPV